MKPEEQEFINQIIKGAGWATDSYIINFSPKEFDETSRFRIMKEMARRGVLHDEERLPCDVSDGSREPDSSTLISVKQVQALYGENLYFNPTPTKN